MKLVKKPIANILETFSFYFGFISCASALIIIFLYNIYCKSLFVEVNYDLICNLCLLSMLTCGLGYYGLSMITDEIIADEKYLSICKNKERVDEKIDLANINHCEYWNNSLVIYLFDGRQLSYKATNYTPESIQHFIEYVNYRKWQNLAT